MNIKPEDLQKLLISAEKITAKQFAEISAAAQKEKISVRDALIKSEIITDEDLGLLEAQAVNVPFVVLTKTSIPPEVSNLLPERVSKQQRAAVFERGKDGIKLALTDPTNTTLVERLEKKTGEKVSVFYATDQDIENAIGMYRTDLQKQFEKLLKEGLGTTHVSEKADAPIEKIVDLLVAEAYRQKASDIHIEPKEAQSLVRFRIDGLLYDALKIPMELHDRIITRIKVLSRLRTDEHMSAQDGKMRMNVEADELDMRVSILPVADGEKVVLRLLSAQSRAYSLSDLGLNEKDLMKVSKSFNKPNGMILSTGPTGSGKTTSIYSILKVLNTREKNITSVEDPIEYRIGGANQVQVNTKTNLTFANGLRSILRQDPDYIFVGEIRDNETAGIAVNAALTGHLVMSTLHTNSAAATIPRLIDMKVEPFLVASTVNVVVAQRLVRQICDHCKLSSTVTETQLKEHFSEDMIKRHYVPVGDNKEIRVYSGKGCDQCHFSGYQGRIGIFEVLEVTPEIKDMITNSQDADAIHNKAVEQGMTTMLDDGLDKITKGLTTIEEVLRVTRVEGI